MNNISFQAHFIRKVPIKVATDNTCKTYVNSEASFIQLDTSSLSDMRLVNNTANAYSKRLRDPENHKNYADSLRNNFNRLFVSPECRRSESFFALTTQKVAEQGEIEDLNPDKIVGVAQVNDDPKKNKYKIVNFQVDPNTNFLAEKREIVDAGKAIDAGIQSVYKKGSSLTFDDKAFGFYMKIGYEPVDRDNAERDYKEETTT